MQTELFSHGKGVRSEIEEPLSLSQNGAGPAPRRNAGRKMVDQDEDRVGGGASASADMSSDLGHDAEERLIGTKRVGVHFKRDCDYIAFRFFRLCASLT